MEIYFLIVLEAKSPRSKCQEIWILVVGLPPGLLDGCLLAMSSYGLSSVCVERGEMWVSLMSLSLVITCAIRLGAHPVTSFNLNDLQGSISKHNRIGEWCFNI